MCLTVELVLCGVVSTGVDLVTMWRGVHERGLVYIVEYSLRGCGNVMLSLQAQNCMLRAWNVCA